MNDDTSLDRAGIAARIPHAAPMALLDRLRYCDDGGLECRTTLPPGTHPLMRDGRWPSTVAIEFAAQAMALHGALMRERAASASSAAATVPATPTTQATETAHVAQTAQSTRTAPAAPVPVAAPRGFIAGLRSVGLEGEFLPAGAHELRIEVSRVSGDDVQVMYEFRVESLEPDAAIAHGRSIVVLDGARFTAHAAGPAR